MANLLSKLDPELINLLPLVYDERRRAIEKHGHRGFSVETLEPGETAWSTIIGEEIGEAIQALDEIRMIHWRPTPEHLGNLKTELIQVAARVTGWLDALHYGSNRVSESTEIPAYYGWLTDVDPMIPEWALAFAAGLQDPDLEDSLQLIPITESEEGFSDFRWVLQAQAIMAIWGLVMYEYLNFSLGTECECPLEGCSHVHGDLGRSVIRDGLTQIVGLALDLLVRIQRVENNDPETLSLDLFMANS